MPGGPDIPNSQPSDPIVFSVDQIKLAIKALNSRKGPGLDNLPPKAIKLLVERTIKTLSSIFNDINKG